MKRIIRQTKKVWNFPHPFNKDMKQMGYHAAMLPIPPLSRRLRNVTVAIIDTAREELAYKLAPWLIDPAEVERE